MESQVQKITNVKQTLNQVRNIVDQVMKKRCCAYVPINSEQIIYYVPLRGTPMNGIVESQWCYRFDMQNLHVRIAYNTMRTIGILLKIQGQRAFTEVSLILKTLNLQSKQLIYKISTQGMVFLKLSIQLNFLSRKSIPSYLESMIKSLEETLQKNSFIFAPYFLSQSIPEKNKKVQSYHQRILGRKQAIQISRKSRSKASKIKMSIGNPNVVEAELFQVLTLMGTKLMQVNWATKEENSIELRRNFDQSIERLSDIDHKNVCKQEQNGKNNHIMKGITIIQIIESNKNTKVGVHSVVTVQKYKYFISPSISFEKRQLREKQKCAIDKSNDKQREKVGKGQSVRKQSEKPCIQPNWLVEQGYLATKSPRNSIESIKSFENQYSLLVYLRSSYCKYICRYYTEIDDSKQCLYMPYYRNSLAQLLQREKQQKGLINFQKKLKLLVDIVRGVDFLASRWISHRDLKPQNLMITESFVSRIIDFGSSCPIYGHRPYIPAEYRLLGTRQYHFPYEECCEQLKSLYSRSQYNQHQYFDCYSIGRIIKDMFFESKEVDQQLKQSMKIIMEALTFVMGRCLDSNPDDRLSTEEIMFFLDDIIQILCSQQNSSTSLK